MSNLTIKMLEVKSSNISLIGYAPKKKILRITFTSGASYDYENVPPKIFVGLITAESHGEYFYKRIKGNPSFPYHKI